MVNPPDWTDVADDLAALLARVPAEPVCFVIGAGASLSSGAPTGAQVVEALDASTSGRLGDVDAAQRRRAVDAVAEFEKRAAIRSLFDGGAPYVGYRLLAAMGRTRRIVVLNLNWDDHVERACAVVGVPCASVVLDDIPAARAALASDAVGVTCVHLHGAWTVDDFPLRYGTLETVSFPDEQQALLVDRALSLITVVIGASLAPDLNVHELMQRLGRRTVPLAQQRPVWLFQREQSLDAPTASLLARWMASQSSPLNASIGSDVDFDRLMVLIRRAETGLDFEHVRAQAFSAVPGFAELVWPRPALLRDLLDQPVVALVGEERLGKTATAHLLAYLRCLWKDPRPSVRTFVGSSAARQAVATAISAPPDAAAVELVLEDPFGQEDLEDDEGLLAALGQLVALHGAPGVIVTSRLRNWTEATMGGAGPALLEERVSDSDPAAWYARRDLLAFLARVDPVDAAALEEQVRTRELNTPDRIRAARDGFNADPDDPGNVTDKAGLLSGLLGEPDHRDMALAVICARLQALSAEPRTERELFAPFAAFESTSDWRRARSMLHRFEVDGQRRVKLLHSTDREAVDRVLVERHDDLAAMFQGAGAALAWARAALELWQALNLAEPEDAGRGLPGDVRLLWVGALADRAARLAPDRAWPALEALLDEPDLDFWGVCEVVYEALRRYERLGQDDKRTGQFVTRVLADRERMGAYAVLEAMLYLQTTAPYAVWAPLTATIAELSSDGAYDEELALVFDGLVWRPPAVGRNERDGLFRMLLDAAARRPRLEGAFALACAYHAQGAAFLSQTPGLRDPSAGTAPLDADAAAQAARMVRFHFAHQSRARAEWARRPFEGGTVEYLFQTLWPEALDPGRAERLVALVERLAAHPEHAGWAVHLALNVSTTQGELTGALGARVAAIVEHPADDGLRSAAVSYETRSPVAERLVKLLRAPGEPDRTLDLLVGGVRVDAWRVVPPRFRFVRDIAFVHGLLGVPWKGLNRRAGVDTSDPEALAARYEAAAEEATARGADPRLVGVLLARVRGGDLRDVDAAAAARVVASDDPYVRTLVAAADLIAATTGTQGALFP